MKIVKLAAAVAIGAAAWKVGRFVYGATVLGAATVLYEMKQEANRAGVTTYAEYSKMSDADRKKFGKNVAETLKKKGHQGLKWIKT